MNTEKPKRNLVLSLTKRGDELGLEVAHILSFEAVSSARLKELGGVMRFMAENFQSAAHIVFIGATGIVVRAIAPHLQDKFTDPAVLVLDEAGQFVISLLSGHAGGANALTTELSKALGASAVITTATDVNKRASLDLLLKALGIELRPYRDLILKANMAIASNDEVALFMESDFLNTIETVPSLLDWLSSVPGFVLYEDWELFQSSNLGLKIYIGTKHSKIEAVVHKVIPKCYGLGTGVKKNMDTASYLASLQTFLEKADISPYAIETAGSIDLKKDETCLKEAAALYGWQLIFYTKEDLKVFEDQFPKSDWVMKTVGVGSVSGPSAMKICSATEALGLTLQTLKLNGCTFTLGRINK